MSVTWDYVWAKPTPLEVRRTLLHLADELEEMVEPMTVAGELARVDIQGRFTTKTSPDGENWPAWRASYVAYGLTHNTGGMMIQSGDTLAAISQRSAYVPTNQGLFIDTSGIPEWGMWNNFGAERTSPGAGATSAERKADYASWRAENEGVAEFGELEGENFLPPRTFLGISTEASYKMDAAFYAWFEGEVAFATSTLGKPFFRHAKRSAIGQFAPL